jgi:hypothetical protein
VKGDDWQKLACDLNWKQDVLLKACPTGFFHGKTASPKFQFSSPGRQTWGIFNPWTWRQSSPIKQSRLDYFLVSEDLYSLVKYTKIIPGYKTDHSVIIFTFPTSLAKWGKGYWKFNSQLLRNTDYIKRVKTCIYGNYFRILFIRWCGRSSQCKVFMQWPNFFWNIKNEDYIYFHYI